MAVDFGRPNPPLAKAFDGLRVWKPFWEVVGLRNGALMFVADLLAFGELTLEYLLIDELVLRCMFDLLTRLEMSRL